MIGNPTKLIKWLIEQPQDKIFECVEYKKKRNNNQNSRYWVLLYKLALKLNIGIEELHFKMLKEYSQRYEILVPSSYNIRGIEYYEKKSKIIKDNKEFYVYYVYTPSHELNTKEFSLLLQGLCEECEQQGIDSRSIDEIMRDEANGKMYNE